MRDQVQSMQDVYDLLIEACEHSPRFRTRGASALRFLNGYEDALRINIEVMDGMRRRAAIADRSPQGGDKGTLGPVHESGGASSAIAQPQPPIMET